MLSQEQIEQLVFGSPEQWALDVDQLEDVIRPVLSEMVINGAEAAAEKYNIAGSFDIERPHVQQFLEGYTGKFTARVSTTFGDTLRAVVTDGVEQGLTMPELAQAVRDAMPDTFADQTYATRFTVMEHADMIARTETVRARQAGQTEQFREAGFTREIWRAGPGACEFCIEMDGRTAAIDENFLELGDTLTADTEDGGQVSMSIGYEPVGYPPLHPLCGCDTAPDWESLPPETP